jgi:D-glycero-D-manno-heptose 1,7-bisphosphate phosphatase
MTSVTKLVILDRDGVINFDSRQYIKTPAEWEPIPGSLDAIARLNHAGFHVAIATNQSGIGRGMFDMATLAAIHTKMHRAVAQVGGRIDAVFYCPHAATSDCSCRKPKPGMLNAIGERFQTSLTGVWSVGDSPRDIQAAVAAGAVPVLVLTGNGAATLAGGEVPANTRVFDNLADVARALVSETDPA